MNPNIINMIKAVRGKSTPKEFVMSMLTKNKNIIPQNLMDMANKNDTNGLEQFARNYCKERNIDFDKELKNIKDAFM